MHFISILMKPIKPFFNLLAKPGPKTYWVLATVFFAAVVVGYGLVASKRHAENPDDKVVPTYEKIWDGFKKKAFQEDRRDEVYHLWHDTWASSKRFGIAAFFLIFAVLLGLQMGVFPYWEALFLKFALFTDKVPALALLPILFIALGLGETSKIALIVIGVFPTIVLDTFLRAKDIAKEQIIKGLTLGASHQEVAFRIVLPQIMPDVLNTIRLNFKGMILFLIAGEGLASQEGLGYRIFLVRRYLAMDVIIPYVIWISILAFVADFTVRLWIQKRYSWRAGT